MNIGTRLILSAALAVGSTIGAAALGQTPLRDLQAEVSPAPAGDGRSTSDSGTTAGSTTAFGSYPGLTDAERLHTAEVGLHGSEPLDSDVREDGVRSELLAAAEAGEISWAAAERVSEDIGSYIRGERRADVI